MNHVKGYLIPLQHRVTELLEHHFGSFLEIHTRHHYFSWLHRQKKGPCEIAAPYTAASVFRETTQQIHITFNRDNLERKRSVTSF